MLVNSSEVGQKVVVAGLGCGSTWWITYIFWSGSEVILFVLLRRQVNDGSFISDSPFQVKARLTVQLDHREREREKERDGINRIYICIYKQAYLCNLSHHSSHTQKKKPEISIVCSPGSHF